MVCGTALADEKTGNLVFNAMKQMQETHQAFLGDVRNIKAARKAAMADRDAVREAYRKATEGSLDQREFHARYSYALAKVYRALYDEAKLTHQVAAKQLGILNKLNDSVASGRSSVSGRKAAAVVATARPILENGRALMASLSAHRGGITDPVINAKLSGGRGHGTDAEALYRAHGERDQKQAYLSEYSETESGGTHRATERNLRAG